MGHEIYSIDDDGNPVDAELWDELLGKDDKPDPYTVDIDAVSLADLKKPKKPENADKKTLSSSYREKLAALVGEDTPERTVNLTYRQKLVFLLGGPGSGNFDHEGRPGEVGGSGPGGGGDRDRGDSKSAAAVQDAPTAKPAEPAEKVEPRSRKPLTVAPSAPPKDKPLTVMFGGSFNPPHSGHVQAVLDAVKMLEDAGYTVGKVIVAPTADKLLSKKLGDKMYPLKERTELAKRTFTDPRIEVSSGPGEEAEAETGKLRRTQLADWAAKRNKDTNVVNVTGEDAAPGSPPGFPSLYEGDKGTSHEGYHYLAVPREEGGASSTKIREAIKSGGKVPDMTREAEEYLRKMLEKNPHIKLSFDLGGPGSGHFGHASVPGQRGGSAPGGGGSAVAEGVPRDASGALDVEAWEKLDDDERSKLYDTALTDADKDRWIDERNKSARKQIAEQEGRLKKPLSDDEKIAVVSKLATLNKVDSYPQTRFILPDGTRVGGGGESEHYDIATRAGVNLWDAKEAGVIRFTQRSGTGDVGAEVGGPISHAQAEHLLDAALYKPGSGVYIDLVPVRSKVGKATPNVGDTKQFDPERATAAAVRRWVNGHYDESIPWPTTLTSLTGHQRLAIQLNILHDFEESWVNLGGPGSGHFGHAGRPGERGGSAAGAGAGEGDKASGERRGGSHKEAGDYKDALAQPMSPPPPEPPPERVTHHANKIRNDPKSSAIEKDNADLFGRAEAISEASLKDGDSEKRFGTVVGQDKHGNNIVEYTSKEYRDPTTGVMRRRSDLHEDVLTEVTKDAPRGLERPRAIILGGLTAAGKSTFVDSLKEHVNMKDYVNINADEMKEKLPEYNGENAFEMHEESSHMAKAVTKLAMKNRQNLILDATMGTEGELGDHGMLGQIEKLKAQGYDVQVMFMDVDVDTSVHRSMNRYKEASEQGKQARYVPGRIIRKNEDPDYGSKPRKTYEAVKRSGLLSGEGDGYIMIDNRGLEGPTSYPPKTKEGRGGGRVVERKGNLVIPTTHLKPAEHGA